MRLSEGLKAANRLLPGNRILWQGKEFTLTRAFLDGRVVGEREEPPMLIKVNLTSDQAESARLHYLAREDEAAREIPDDLLTRLLTAADEIASAMDRAEVCWNQLQDLRDVVRAIHQEPEEDACHETG